MLRAGAKIIASGTSASKLRIKRNNQEKLTIRVDFASQWRHEGFIIEAAGVVNSIFSYPNYPGEVTPLHSEPIEVLARHKWMLGRNVRGGTFILCVTLRALRLDIRSMQNCN